MDDIERTYNVAYDLIARRARRRTWTRHLALTAMLSAMVLACGEIVLFIGDGGGIFTDGTR